jgi:hypothetical protein
MVVKKKTTTPARLDRSQHEILQAEYVNLRGEMCPNCRGRSTSRGPLKFEAGIGMRDVTCTSCDANWVEQLQIVGFAYFREPERKKKRRP